MGIRFYNLNGFFVKKLAHGVSIYFYKDLFPKVDIPEKKIDFFRPLRFVATLFLQLFEFFKE